MWRLTFIKIKVLQFQKVTTTQEGRGASYYPATLMPNKGLSFSLFSFFPKTPTLNTDLVVLNWKFIGPPDPRYNVYYSFFTQNTAVVKRNLQ